MDANDEKLDSHRKLLQAIQDESHKFQEYYLWLERAMPPAFFEDITHEQMMLIAHNLIGFDMQDYFSTINMKKTAMILCLESPDADLIILEKYSMYGIKNFQAYVSREPLPFPGVDKRLRIGIIHFIEAVEGATEEDPLSQEEMKELKLHAKKRNPEMTQENFELLMQGINKQFLKALPIHRITLALDMFFRAISRDNCQYEVRYNEDWEQTGVSSMQIVMAWRNCPKFNFLYRIAQTIHRHGLVMKRVNATYVDPYSKRNVLIMVLGIHGSHGEAAWDAANIPDFLRELVRVKYFASTDLVAESLVNKGVISGNKGNLLRALGPLIHQFLLHIDPNFYTPEHIEESYIRQPEFSYKLGEIFSYKFNPDRVDLDKYEEMKEDLIKKINKLDTGHEHHDTLDKNTFLQSLNIIHHTLKTNFYRNNLTALSFRLDPKFLEHLPFDYETFFPEIPYGIFYTKGMHFFGFHIRFKDLARGGLRTVVPHNVAQANLERNHAFTECYNLAYTQHFKNKEIPEGGSKGIIFLKPFNRLESENKILKRELELSKIPEEEIVEKIRAFESEQKEEYLHAAQRSYIESLITLVNCDPDGTIRAKRVLDYLGKPEYLYIGPDENMSNEIIQWIAYLSNKYGYRPGSSFISSKPGSGINHKQYGATSLGVNAYMAKTLEYIGIDPKKDKFTIKLSGGPDGDVAGNMLLNLEKYYPDTAKVVALTDVSGTVKDPEGLKLPILKQFFYEGKPINHYPPEELSDGSFLLDKTTRKSTTAYSQQTLCWRKKQGKVHEEWLTGSEMNFLLRHNMHREPTDVFITAGGRPRTLNEHNIDEFLDDSNKPSSKIIIEGANLYLTPKARRILEEMGVYIIKDSSANKTGVICSSFEILAGLTLGDELFLQHKETLVEQILQRLERSAFQEAELILRTHDETNLPLTEISNAIANTMNTYKYEILDYLERIPLPKDPSSPLIRTAIDYCLPLLKDSYQDKIISEMPELHLKAIIAAHIAAQAIYRRGLTWSPSIVDILPILFDEITPPM